MDRINLIDVSKHHKIEELKVILDSETDWSSENRHLLIQTLVNFGWFDGLKLTKAKLEPFLFECTPDEQNDVSWLHAVSAQNLQVVQYLLFEMNYSPAPGEMEFLIDEAIGKRNHAMLEFLTGIPDFLCESDGHFENFDQYYELNRMKTIQLAIETGDAKILFTVLKSLKNRYLYETKFLENGDSEYGDFSLPPKMFRLVCETVQKDDSLNAEFFLLKHDIPVGTHSTPESILEYLIDGQQLKPEVTYSFIFSDGTEFVGNPHEFAPYCHSHLRKSPDDTYEIHEETKHKTENEGDGSGPTLL